MSSGWARAALSHRICTGLPRRTLGKLIEELARPWLAQQESRLRDRRGRDRLRAEGAGPGHELPFTDRVIVTLVILRFQLPARRAGSVLRRAPLHDHPRGRRDPAAAGRSAGSRCPASPGCG